MNIEEKAALTIRKLIQATRRGLVKWNAHYGNLDFPVPRDTRDGRYYYATVGDAKFRVYEVETQNSHDGENFFITTEPCVEIVNNDHVPLWKLPQSAEMWDLIHTIEIKANDVEGILDRFLSQEE